MVPIMVPRSGAVTLHPKSKKFNRFTPYAYAHQQNLHGIFQIKTLHSNLQINHVNMITETDFQILHLEFSSHPNPNINWVPLY